MVKQKMVKKKHQKEVRKEEIKKKGRTKKVKKELRKEMYKEGKIRWQKIWISIVLKLHQQKSSKRQEILIKKKLFDIQGL